MIMFNIVLVVLLWNCLFKRTNNLHCGLVGFSGNKAANTDKLKLLMFMNQERGRDSLGYYAVDTTSDAAGVLYKEKGLPLDVMIAKDFIIPPNNMFIGHVRAATVGVVNANNAHPFKHGNIVLAMNGTISNHWDLATSYGVKTNTIFVDSEVLCALLNHTQNKEPLTKILGPCAVIFADTNTNIMYVYRNTDRPLFRGTVDNCLYMSSLESSLKMIGCESIKEFKEDSLYEIVDGRITKTYHVKRAVEEVKKPVKVELNRNSNNTVLSEDDDLIYTLTSFIHVNVTAMIKQFVRPLANWSTYSPHVTINPDSYYKVLGCEKNGNTYITIRDDSGKLVNLSKYCFRPHYLLLRVNGYAMLNCDVHVDKKKKKIDVGTKSDIVLIRSIDIKNQQASITNLSNNFEFIVDVDWLDCLGSKQADKIMSTSPGEVEKETKKEDEYPDGQEYPLPPQLDKPNLNNMIRAQELEEEINNAANVDIDSPPKDKVVLKVEDFGSIKELADYTLENVLDVVEDIKAWCYAPEAKRKCQEIEDLIMRYINTSEEIKKLEDAATK